MRIHDLVYVIAAVAALAAAGTWLIRLIRRLLRGRQVHGVASAGNSPG